MREPAEQWLKSHTAMQQDARLALSAQVPLMLTNLQNTGTGAIGIAGAPGSGKSTLARLLAHVLDQSGRPTVVLSLDDYYLDRAARESLANSRHKLMRQRGVPGTHDWNQLVQDFDQLREGHTNDLRLPVFDKSTDDRSPPAEWRKIDIQPACVIIEGWCVGVPAQSPENLEPAINEWERLRDPDGAWRGYVNQQLARYHSDLQHRVDQFWYLSIPGWDCVIDWRWQQERELDRPALRSRVEVATFLSSFERIVNHMQATATRWADWQLQVDRSHCLAASE